MRDAHGALLPVRAMASETQSAAPTPAMSASQSKFSVKLNCPTVERMEPQLQLARHLPGSFARQELIARQTCKVPDNLPYKSACALLPAASAQFVIALLIPLPPDCNPP